MNTDDGKHGKRRFGIRRIWIWTLGFLSFAYGSAACAWAAEPSRSADVKTLDGLVGQWMALRTTLAEEKREWEERRRQWEDEISLLEKEAEALRREREDGDSFASSFETKRAEALARKERLEVELRKLRAVLDRAEADLRQWSGRIPEGLRPPLASGFAALPATQKQADPLPLVRRAQAVAALYAQIETLQNQFHAVRETLDAEGTRRQVDVLYLGLARAFAVSPGNDWAAVGVPSDEGWAWMSAPEEAATVRLAIDMVNRQAGAQLVALPLQIDGEVQP
jgi:hypothetical protein